MPSFSKILLTLVAANLILAAPLPQLAANSLVKGAVPATRRQLAGEGAAADSILTDTDNGVGYGTENAEDNVADNISSVTGDSTGSSGGGSGGSSPPPPPPPPPPHKRQLAGEGAAADSILTDTDNGVGYGIENAEDNVADNISSVTGDSTGSSGGGSGGSSPPPPPPPPPPHKRQLDKIANGAGAIGNAAGVGSTTDPVVAVLDNADGTLTSGAANAGAEVGGTEETTLENAGSAVPKRFRRQLDKIANGAGAIGNAAGVGSTTDPVVAVLDNADGTLTSGAANAGAEVGGTEETTLENAGSAVPKRF